jgi:hypothetical protein
LLPLGTAINRGPLYVAISRVGSKDSKEFPVIIRGLALFS